MEQHRIAHMLHANTSVVTSLVTGSSPVIRTTLACRFQSHNIRTEITRITHEMLDSGIKVECACHRCDSAPRSLDRTHYKVVAVLAKWWCMGKKLLQYF